ncbi:MAG: hypothetical protein E5X68_31970 [Mesorhizobium sp.]|nr:MAG: hypothetical protein EOQ84_32210 [Mesorhizobium sp.]RWL19851.1 MAG: hypothetical protein EOR58_31885 [Mesorhizobium sp.]RWL23490.1 MAG: hypothetical protein EOR63_32055 [Mesorhizobium sp.]RWL34853.1 MAG: hypothetical protein EOR59_24065 [Mesorhizobium sp.]RWL44600.1 MAG: hypothetical protein EOR61_29640 [Mesorhizobium sp.]
MMFAPLDFDHREKRSDLHRAARLEMLHERLAKRLDRVERAVDEVERAAAVLVDVTHGNATEAFEDAIRSNSSAAFLHLDAGQTLGL